MWADSEGLFTKINSRTPHKKKSEKTKNPKKNPKFLKIFWGFKISMPYLGVNSSLNSVFQSFFIYKILVHQTIFRNIRKIQKIQNKFKDFFWGFKIRTPYVGVKNPSISVFQSFFIHKNHRTPKKIRKNPINPRIFWGLKIRTPYLGENNPSGNCFTSLYLKVVYVTWRTSLSDAPTSWFISPALHSDVWMV